MAAVERLVDWTAEAREVLALDRHMADLDRMLSSGNGAQRQRRRHEAGERVEDIYAAVVAETRATYAEAGTALAVPCGEATA